jgi:asparagine synthase (glutamine-hydrolysing)
VIADELEDRAGQLAGIDQRHPFYDRRLAEFGLALPDDQRWKDGTTKSVIRRGLASLLPPAIATREDKAEFSSTFVDALEALGGRQAFAQLRSEEAGWVNGSIVRERYETMIHLYTRVDESYIAHTDGLWEVIGLEMWLERAVGAGQGAGRD